ncbi:hypothetical protein PI124_g15474 [Phytophthora idaei]|nr:hypothetical protein PI124_g15474 [Phytophthora idaei]
MPGEVPYPVLVSPSYVFSGAGMIVASDEGLLRVYLSSDAVKTSRLITVSKFILIAKEIEFDGVTKEGVIVNYAVSQLVVNSGAHTGGATLLMGRANGVKVSEYNMRASRTSTFISKTFNLNFTNQVTKAMIGLLFRSVPIALTDIYYVGVKALLFQVPRLHSADRRLGEETAWTSEVACCGTDISNQDIKREFAEEALILQKLGYTIFATPATQECLDT